ncbi:MAG: 3-methyl-2-oxobutanoate hydroxymethyltransferase, partial [Bdellovibrionota bacterium]
AKAEARAISMVTCYDYTSARIVAESAIDCILVGDSVAMTMHGHDSTLAADANLMAMHIEAVKKGAPEKFIVGDMPFLAHRGSLDKTLEAVRTIMKAGAQAVKIEGIDGSDETIRHIVESGVPVMGHLGLTPQSVHQFGGFKVQSTGPEAKTLLLSQARRLEAAGVFALVLEAVPSEVAQYVTERLNVPTIGIGAGNGCSGQVLVFQDLLGFNRDFKPKFVRRFIDGFSIVKGALDQFDAEVKAGTFPNASESYAMPSRTKEITQ